VAASGIISRAAIQQDFSWERNLHEGTYVNMGELYPFIGRSRDELNAVDTHAPEVAEEAHFYTCAKCGQKVDMRKLGDMFHHEAAFHLPLLSENNSTANRT
jgi:hypothetical protein